MTEKVDHSDTLRSYSFLGSATFINMLVSLVRVKVIALLLGPAGVGLMGLLLNVMITASTLIGLGIGSAGTQQIAEQIGKNNQENIDRIRRALFWGTTLLALIGGVVVFIFRHYLADKVLGDPSLSENIGWLSVGIALAIAVVSQSALITGMRRVGEIAKLQIFSQLSATIIGLSLIALFGIHGLIFHIIAFPLTAFVVSHIYVARLPKIKSSPSSVRELSFQFYGLARLGVALMLAGFVTAGGQLMVFTLIQKELGIVALGYFQASWGISMVYLSFILAVLGTDYYPKLAGIFHNGHEACKLINQQTEVAIVMAAPLIIFMLGFMPWAIQILYSAEFAPATGVLRWQVMADVLRIASAPLRLVMLASGRGRIYLFTETIATGVFVVSTWILLPHFGVVGGGIGYLAMNLIYLPVVYFIARKQIGFKWNGNVKKKIVGLLLLSFLCMSLSFYDSVIGIIFSFSISMVCGINMLNFMINSSSSSGQTGVSIKTIPASFVSTINRKLFKK